MAAGKHPTIHDVAERAGVSKSLVSLVLRGASNISDAKKAAVIKAAADLGYRPNLAARSLVQRRSHIIGVLVSDLHNPFFHETVDGIYAAALEADYRPLLTSGQLAVAREVLGIETLLELRVDGMIRTSPRVSLAKVNEVAMTVPTVAVGITSRSDRFDTIAGDERIGTSLVVDHLVELGHRRIAHIDGANGAGARPRRAQYERAMLRHGLGDHIQIVHGDFTEQGGIEGMTKLLRLKPLPTAVFMANDFSAMGGLQVLDDAGLRVPEDISLVGYDNLEAVEYHRISLTTVDQPRFNMGHQAVTLLLERLERHRVEAKHVVLPPKLVVRATAGPPRSRE
jgi:DNA-binding LacI/PurR family transcriptional regulator